MLRPFHFVDINRCASTSIRQSLGDDSPRHVHALARKWRSDDWDSAFCFSFVRNPFDRVASQFEQRYHLTGERGGSMGFVHWLEKRYVQGIIPRYLSAPYEDRLWWPQIDWVEGADGYLLVDMIYRFERISLAWEDLRRHVGDAGRLQHRVRRRDRTPLEVLYTERSMEIVRDFFRRDFVTFGYDPSSLP